MAIDKPSLNDFLPNGFETQDKDGYKVNFDADKISAGYDKDTLEILSGPNLNNLLDNVGKNTHTLQQFLNFFRDMPIGSFPVVNTSNQLDYKSVNSFFRNVGEIVFSAIPLEDGNLRLLDGSLLEYTMTYSRFITYIAGYRTSLPNLFCTQAEFDQSVATYGVCGKFVYDTVTKSLRLPKISGFIQGTHDSGSLGDIVEAGLPNVSCSNIGADNIENRGSADAPFFKTNQTDYTVASAGSYRSYITGFNLSLSNSIYGNSNTVQPQAIKEFIYMVVSIDEAEKQVLSAVYNYKGSVPTYADLPTAVAIGEVYNVIGEDPEGYSGANFAWTGEEWDRLGGTVNLSGYLTKVEGANTYATKASLESNVDYLQQQINTNASNISNIASQEVIEQGIKKIEMLKFASTLGIGKVADTDLFAIINKMKRSSFDRSKFTVVGTLNITDDGIASGFSSSNYLTKTLSLTPVNSVKIKTRLIYSTTGTTSQYSQAKPFLSINNGQSWRLLTDGGDSVKLAGNNITSTSTNVGTLNDNDVIDIELLSSGSNTTVSVKINGVTKTPIQVQTAIGNISDVTLGYYSSDYYFTGSIDLKQFSITVDGIPVFSGNKTGVDTIKPDDYTVVGSPTISDDGIASGFSESNYLTLQSIDVNSLNWKFEGRVKINTTGNTFIFSSTIGDSNSFSLFMVSDTNRLVPRLYLNVNGTKTNPGFTDNDSFIVTAGNTYDFYFERIGNTFYFGAKNISESDYTIKFVTYSGNYPLYSGSLILYYQAGDFEYDLNAFKIYVDGDLVYQPCLKIPFHLSKTGLKVTDKLDRAIDMAEQCGFSQYYGLDEQNGLCLVPQGENITGRRDLISVEEDSNHNVIEKYSDFYCKQSGSCTSGTAITFAQPYKDDNAYKLNVPYSAKSKTGFTPSASGDYTAEGHIYLT